MQGAPLANLRRRSPSYVYLGRLTPALPAGSGRSLFGLPVGRWRRSGRHSGVSTRAAAAGSKGCCCEESARARPGSCRGWAGGGTESPCSRVPAFAPPPPGGAPAATTQSPAPGAGGSAGRRRGKFEITPEPPLRPSSTGAASSPQFLLNRPSGYQTLMGRLQTAPDTRDSFWDPFSPTRAHTQRPECGGPEREASPLEPHSSRVAPPLYPHLQLQWALAMTSASEPPGSEPLD